MHRWVCVLLAVVGQVEVSNDQTAAAIRSQRRVSITEVPAASAPLGDSDGDVGARQLFRDLKVSCVLP